MTSLLIIIASLDHWNINKNLKSNEWMWTTNTVGWVQVAAGGQVRRSGALDNGNVPGGRGEGEEEEEEDELAFCDKNWVEGTHCFTSKNVVPLFQECAHLTYLFVMSL